MTIKKLYESQYMTAIGSSYHEYKSVYKHTYSTKTLPDATEKIWNESSVDGLYQLFTCPKSTTITKVKTELKKNEVYGVFGGTIQIVFWTSGLSLVGIAGAYSPSTIENTYSDVEYILSTPIALTASQDYYFGFSGVLLSATPSGSSSIDIRCFDTTYGVTCRIIDKGGGWGVSYYRNMCFELFEDNSEFTKTQVGTYTADSTFEIGKIRLAMFFKGQFSSEKITLHLTDSLDSPTFTISSNQIDVTNIYSGLSDGCDFYTWVSFDFNREWILDSQEYIIYITSENYVESDDLTIGFVYHKPDWTYIVPQDWFYIFKYSE